MSDTVPFATLQQESARTNEAHGVIAFLVGVLAEVQKTPRDAAALAEIALATIAEWHAGLWKPGPHDDPADWRTP